MYQVQYKAEQKSLLYAILFELEIRLRCFDLKSRIRAPLALVVCVCECTSFFRCIQSNLYKIYISIYIHYIYVCMYVYKCVHVCSVRYILISVCVCVCVSRYSKINSRLIYNISPYTLRVYSGPNIYSLQFSTLTAAACVTIKLSLVRGSFKSGQLTRARRYRHSRRPSSMKNNMKINDNYRRGSPDETTHPPFIYPAFYNS